MTTHLLISAVLRDRVGILRDATGAIFAQGGNIVDVHQNVIGGVFCMNALCTFPADATAAAVRDAVAAALPDAGATISVTEAALEAAPAGERYVAAFSGPDRPGRVHAITEVFAKYGANVEDWRHDVSDVEHTLTIGVVSIPASVELPALRAELEATFAPLGLATSLTHENLFRATNEVGPIHALMRSDRKGVSRNA